MNSRPGSPGSAAPAARPTAGMRRVVVGIGELAVSDAAGSMIITHALGSCIAVVIWDPNVPVAGLLHLLLPESRINPERAERQPATFADTGVPLLLETLRRRGMDPGRAKVWLIGGAELNGGGVLNVGKRNILAARSLLWRAGMMIHKEAVGGTDARTASVTVNEGTVEITTAGRVTLL